MKRISGFSRDRAVRAACGCRRRLPPSTWIPADFAAYVRIDMSDPQVTLGNLNVRLFVASVLQPARFQYPDSLDYDTFFPFRPSFDTEVGVVHAERATRNPGR
ncbi:MAG: hypothetical protein U0521_24565 [Anaerolineae bacterium]